MISEDYHDLVMQANCVLDQIVEKLHGLTPQLAYGKARTGSVRMLAGNLHIGDLSIQGDNVVYAYGFFNKARTDNLRVRNHETRRINLNDPDFIEHLASIINDGD